MFESFEKRSETFRTDADIAQLAPRFLTVMDGGFLGERGSYSSISELLSFTSIYLEP